MAERSFALVMLGSAENDLAACRVLAAALEVPDTIVGFHAQQACEKCLKAVLSAADVEVPRTHDLTRLIDLASGSAMQVPAECEWIDELNPYAVEARYGLVEPGRLDREHALLSAAALLAWAKALLARTGAP